MNKEELLHESLEQRMKGEKGKDWNRKNKTGRESVKEEDGGYPLETKAEEGRDVRDVDRHDGWATTYTTCCSSLSTL